MSRKEYQRQYRLANKERLSVYNKEYQKTYYQANPYKFLYWQIKNRAKKLSIPFNLDLDDIVIPDVCPILSIPLFRNEGNNGPGPNSPSVDRIDPSKGYTKGNVWVISQRANVMKNDASLEELRRFAAWVNQLTH